MKQINVYFDDEDYKKLIEKKGDLSWRDFIMLLGEENTQKMKGGSKQQDEKSKS